MHPGFRLRMRIPREVVPVPFPRGEARQKALHSGSVRQGRSQPAKNGRYPDGLSCPNAGIHGPASRFEVPVHPGSGELRYSMAPGV